MSYGFVYVLGNDAMPGIYKVGMTTKPPMERMDQLSSATACPTPFWLAMFVQVEYPLAVEQEVHAALSDARVNDSREFFRAPLLDIGRALGEAVEEEVFQTMRCTEAIWCEEQDRACLEKQGHFHSQCADPIDWNRRRGFE